MEHLVDERAVALLRVVPAAEVLAHLVGQDAVGDDEIGRVVVEVEVGERALRLLDHHLLEGEHDAHRGLVVIGEQRVHVLELGEQLLAGVEDRVARHRHADHALDERAGELGDAAADGLDLLHPPLRRLGE